MPIRRSLGFALFASIACGNTGSGSSPQAGVGGMASTQPTDASNGAGFAGESENTGAADAAGHMDTDGSTFLSDAGDAPAHLPNVVVVLFDDVGYGDFASFGGKGVATPELDRMAGEGMSFTSFYVQPVCSPSRAALLTGSYPQRVSVPVVLNPADTNGLHPQEVTIADALKMRGYRTALFGKWHLGRPPQLLPDRQGFDEYFGEPYSNDMSPHVMMQDDMVVENDPSDNELTKRYTEHAVSFIEQNKDKPFFLYLAPNMAHVPLGATQPFRGTSARGLYGDVMAELDWSVGQVVATLRRLGLEGATLVVITSDNGPWLQQGKNAGSAGPLREGKHTTFEGGMRTPMIVRWPGIVPAGGVSDEPVSEIDLLPTIAGLAGAALPTDWTIDGKDILSLMRGEPAAKSPHDALFFYNDKALEAVRSGKWKLHFPHPYQHVETGPGGNPVVSTRQIALALFDLDADIGEQSDVAGAHPDVVQKLAGFADQIRADIGDSLTGQKGQNVRPAGK